MGNLDDEEVIVLEDLRRSLSLSDQNDKDKESRPSLFDASTLAVPVAAIKTLLGVVHRSKAETMMGLQDELKKAASAIIYKYDNHAIEKKQALVAGYGLRHIALQSGCELFLKYVTRTFLELPNFEECRQAVLERGKRFQNISLAARDRIASKASDFIPAGSTVLTHGWSRVVAAVLLQASKTKHFDVIILEGRPDASGVKAAKSYAEEANIPVTVVLDAAMGFVMEKVDLVITGAEGVMENGGVVNMVGTYALAACAHLAGKPFYVAAESYKFARMYPLHQSDLPYDRKNPLRFADTTTTNGTGLQPIELPDAVNVENPTVDFTPSKLITLMFTDLGVLTPSAVSDELIRLYQ